MTQEANIQKITHPPAVEPDWRWLVRWVLLTTLVLPGAFFLATPLAAVGLLLQKLITSGRPISSETGSILSLVGFVIAFALTLAGAQWLLLRRYLPQTRDWFLATAAGFMAGCVIIGSVLALISANRLISNPAWRLAIIPVGIGLGLAQWLVLRRTVQHAYWIILVDGLAFGGLLFTGESITSLTELIIFLLLPGTITGLGMWWLLRTTTFVPSATAVPRALSSKTRRPLKIFISLAAFVALFFFGIWAYASSQLALAKAGGVYATPEEAVTARNSLGWGGAQVAKLEDVHAGPNNPNGKQPHIWFGGARVFLDKVPEGWDRSEYLSGSFYVHVRDGWVYMGEGAFPEVVGWVMELYDLEGTREWIQSQK